MSPSSTAKPDGAGRTFKISRSFDAPRELVWMAWTDPEALARWFGPVGFKLGVKALDLRPGGAFHYSMVTPNQTMWGKFVYREISPPGRLVFVSSFSDPAGATARAPFSETWPMETLSTVTLTEAGGRTTVTVTGEPLNATADEERSFREGFESMRGGWGGTLDQLEAYLGGS